MLDVTPTWSKVEASHLMAAGPINFVSPMVTIPLVTIGAGTTLASIIERMKKDMGIDILAPVNSNGDPVQQITDMNNLLNLGSKGIVVGPLDSAAISRALDAASAKNVPVVAVDVAPTQGKVAMVVRADNTRSITGS